MEKKEGKGRVWRRRSEVKEKKIMYRGSRPEPAFTFNKSHYAVNRSRWKPLVFNVEINGLHGEGWLFVRVPPPAAGGECKSHWQRGLGGEGRGPWGAGLGCKPGTAPKGDRVCTLQLPRGIRSPARSPG